MAALLAPYLLGSLIYFSAVAGQTPEVRYWQPASSALPAAAAIDWSWAGYRDGDVPLPYAPVKFDVVKDFAAKGNGVADDTAALLAAVAAVNSQKGVLFLPAGTYRLSQPLVIASSGVVIRGAGENQTRIVINQPLEAVYPGTQGVWARPSGGFLWLRGTPDLAASLADGILATVSSSVAAGAKRIFVDTTSGITSGQMIRLVATSPTAANCHLSAKVASVDADGAWVNLDRAVPFALDLTEDWSGSVHRYAPALQDSGIESLTVQFNSPRYGAHGSDAGYNAVAITSASHVWVDKVTVLNADNGVVLEGADHVTLRDITIGTSASRWAASDTSLKRVGHHAIALSACHAVMVARFTISASFYHDLAVTNGSALNVFTGGAASNLNLHHTGQPPANLFSDIDTGRGRRLYSSPDSGPAGEGTTLWNLRASAAPTTRQSPPPPTRRPPSPPPASPPPVPTGDCGMLEMDADMYGADIKYVAGTTLADCFKACASTARCGAFTLVPAQKRCYLKMATGWRKAQLAGAQSVVVVPCTPLARAASTGGAGNSAAPQLRGRRLHAASDTPGTLALPRCDYGAALNFVGNFMERKCSGWLVKPLDKALPLELYAQQWFDRGNLPPLPNLPGAHRPKPSAATDACRTWMDGPDDPLECWILAYDHCIPGYTSRNSVPDFVEYNERKVLDTLYAQTRRDGSFGTPPVPPSRYSRICVADPARAGKGACARVKPKSYRIHVFGFKSAGPARCDHVTTKISFVKAHVTPQHQPYVWGRVGHGAVLE